MEAIYIIVVVLILLLILSFLGHIVIQKKEENKDDSGSSSKTVVVVGGCAGTQYGCCPNGKTAKMNAWGSNCVLQPVPPQPIYVNPPGSQGCSVSPYGCCNDGVTYKNSNGSNCSNPAPYPPPYPPPHPFVAPPGSDTCASTGTC